MVSEAFGKTFVDTTLAPTTTGTTTNNLRFPGQYEDQETGTYYNYMRTYLPMVGRYGESDPIGLGGGVNTYVYGNLAPLSNVDVDGRFAFVIPLIVNGVIAAGADAIYQGVTKGFDCVDLADVAIAGAAGAAGSAAIAGGVSLFLKEGGYMIKGMTFFKRGNQKKDGYVNHTIFKSGSDPNVRIEWATSIGKDNRVTRTGAAHWHDPWNPKTHHDLPPSGAVVGLLYAVADDCKCKK
jgi:RHS repeat-associated protein